MVHRWLILTVVGVIAVFQSRSEAGQTAADEENQIVKVIRGQFGFSTIKFHRDGRVSTLKLEGVGEDFHWAELKPLSRLETLVIRFHTITNTGLKHIGRLRSLRYLDIHGHGKITNDGLKHLQKLSKLETLIITSMPITEEIPPLRCG